MADETTTITAPAAPEQTTVTPTGQTGGATVPTETISMTQADLDRMIAERLERERTKAAKQADAARKALEEKALADQAQWKELAEKRAADLTALQAKAELAERQGAVIEQLYKTRLAGLSAPIRKAVESLPVDDMLARLAWLDSNEALFKASSTVPDIRHRAAGRRGLGWAAWTLSNWHQNMA